MPMSIGDLAGFATGLACVAFAAQGSIWNYPFALLNSLILGVVFLQARLFGDMTLQGIFFILGVQGWIQWRIAASRKAPRPLNVTPGDFLIGIMFVSATTFALREALVRLGGATPWPDAIITSASLWAQWLLNRKSISSWAWWIAVDAVSIPLYWSRQLPMIAFLYVLFLGLCVQGWRKWRLDLR
jgi:nicotinamide mononucleotide transporter